MYYMFDNNIKIGMTYIYEDSTAEIANNFYYFLGFERRIKQANKCGFQSTLRQYSKFPERKWTD